MNEHTRRPTPPAYWARARSELAARDPVIARLIDAHPTEAVRGSGDAFRTLMNAIVGQQISVAAAAGIWGRLTRTFPELTPASLATTDPATLRAIGFSARKAEYALGVAEAFETGRVDPGRWHSMSDDDIRAELTAVRGVGPWTADMVLIFFAHRPDVLPLGDIGLVNAAARLYGWDGAEADGAVSTRAARRELLGTHAERWKPWRTVATWYVWCDLDEETVVY